MNQPTNDKTKEIYLNMKDHGITHRDIDNDNSTLRNWLNWHNLPEIALVGLGAIIALGAVIFDAWLNGGL